MERPDIREQRRAALLDVAGSVLEIGSGCGSAWQDYPAGPGGATSLIGIEPGEGMTRRAARRRVAASFPVRITRARAEAIPFPDESFDTVASTYTLCTIPDTVSALREIGRVLRKGGRFVFLEHGRAGDPRHARWQARLNPIHGIYAGGCRLDVLIDAEIRRGGFAFERLEKYVGRPGGPIIASMYRGIARRA